MSTSVAHSWISRVVVGLNVRPLETKPYHTLAYFYLEKVNSPLIAFGSLSNLIFKGENSVITIIGLFWKINKIIIYFILALSSTTEYTFYDFCVSQHPFTIEPHGALPPKVSTTS
jgi:hypothetical protein